MPQPRNTGSVWMAPDQIEGDGPLRADTTADLCVIGAGIAGLSVAYWAARDGRSVVVLDDGPIGGGETGRTTAHLTNALDDRAYELERMHGLGGGRIAAESHAAAIDSIESIVAREHIDCDFRRLDGYLIVPDRLREQEDELLERELRASQRAAVNGVERLPRVPPGINAGACLRFPAQAQFEPVRYLAGLARAIRAMGGRIHTHTHAASFHGGSDANARTADGFTVRADAIVVATNTPVNDRVTMHTKQAPYRTYVVGLRIPHDAVPPLLFWDGYWDDEAPYHYVRLASASNAAPDDGHDILIVGGADHKTGQDDGQTDRFASLAEWARRVFPAAGEVTHRWSGQVMEPVDGMAYIGRNPMDADNVYIVTGDSGNGMTHGALAGLLIGDLLAGRENPWQRLYDPSRKSVRSAGEFLRENANVARQYADWIDRGDVKSEDEIAPGTGAILRHGLRKLAIYRDPSGNVTRRSAVCPHLGCIVRWNATEHSWDCPCHGSRFTAEGTVVNGPANRDLLEADRPHTASRPEREDRAPREDPSRGTASPDRPSPAERQSNHPDPG